MADLRLTCGLALDGNLDVHASVEADNAANTAVQTRAFGTLMMVL
jgi:hypothetical protein